MSGMLQDWVTERARERPDARAVIGPDGALTYAEVENLSNRLAVALRSRGCHRGDRVGILMPQSAIAVASLIGVLKAACTYVPVDPVGGRARTAEILGQCEPRILLSAGCEPEVLEDLDQRGALDGVQVGWLGRESRPGCAAFDRSDVEIGASEPPRVDSDPDDPAYVLFTSGTTGTPKGVPVTHASVHAFIDWVVDYFGLGPGDRLSGHTALTFDLSTFDIYAALASGAELHQVPKRARMLPHEAARFIQERGLTLWFSVPSQLSYIARFDALAGRDLGSLKHVAWCGDVLPTPSLLYWKERLPGVAFTNLYGPTETTVASSYHRVAEDFDDPTADIPIGVACPGEELLILDQELQEVPDGEAGDIYIGGVGLSPGYWRDPERTRAAFVADPRPGHEGRRLYRTGDRGRRRPDGAVSFLGRADFQIKTSGYRVEPAEVERAVLQLDEVAACAVVPVTVDDFTGTGVGCAYVPSNGAGLRAGALKRRLTEKLPGYMIPTRWMELKELPVDGRGKIDRARARALMGG